MKKISIITMLVILLSAVFTAPAYAVNNVETLEINGVTFEYQIINNKYAKITEGREFIPEEIDGYPVTIIGESAFQYTGGYDWEDDPCPYGLSKKWVIPDTVTCIEEDAFRDNGYINTIEIPPSVTYIGDQAFADCYNLNEITIPDGVSKIEKSTFYRCKRLSSVTLGNGIRRIEESAFEYCSSLKKINFPRELYYIGESAFDHCEKLLKFDLSQIDTISILEKGCITNKNAKIIGRSFFIRDYALENDIKYFFAINSNSDDSSYVGDCYAGNKITLFVDREKLTDYKTSNPKIIKLTKKGKLTALKKGTAKFKVTLPSGKVYNGTFKVLDNPVLKKKVTKGKKTSYKKVTTISVKQGKTVSVTLFGKAKSMNNKYTSTSKAQIVSKKTDTIIKIKGKAKGTSNVKIRVNGVKTLKLKVNVK